MSDENERSVASTGSVAGGVSDRSKPIERTPAPHATHGDGTEQRECTEPVAWLVEGCEYDTGCEFQYVAMLKEQADAAAAAGARLTPLYRQPPPVAWQLVHECERLRDEVMMLRLTDQEREALWAIASHQRDDATFGTFAKILRRLFERTNVTEYPRSKLLPTVMPDKLDAIIEGLERIKALEAEIARLRAAVRALLDGVNERYPDKNPREWTCPHMARLDRLVPPLDEK